MNKRALIKHFGSVRQTASALGVTTQAVYKWDERIPELQAVHADQLTNGKLKYNKRDYQ